MAGLGYKLFAAGEVLTAANLQGYAVDQSTMVFASSAARTSALSAPSQGMVSWLNDSGTAWQYYELYNVSTNPGGASAAGWYPISGAAMFFGTAGKTTVNNTVENVGASGYLYTEIIDPLAWHSAATNTDRITPNVAGVYRVTASCQWASGATGNRRVRLTKNGVDTLQSRVSAAIALSNNLSHVVQMNGSTDYFIIDTFQDNGTTLASTVSCAVEFLRPSQS
jgi:hypothetical protein